MTLARLLASLHTVGWAVYFGGAASMELLWRPAQEEIPPSLVNVVCQRMGRRYRWIALAALALIGATGLAQLAEADLLTPGSFSPSDRYGRTLLLATLGWSALVAIVVTLAIVAHPALHVRTSGEATPEERAASRAAVARAIRRMDVFLRLDLAVGAATVLCAASLSLGGLF